MWREIQTSQSNDISSGVNIVRADARDKHHRIGYNGPWHFLLSFVHEDRGGEDSFEIANQPVRSHFQRNGLQIKWLPFGYGGQSTEVKIALKSLERHLLRPLFLFLLLLSNLRIKQPRDLPLPRPSHFLNSLSRNSGECIRATGNGNHSPLPRFFHPFYDVSDAPFDGFMER